MDSVRNDPNQQLPVLNLSEEYETLSPEPEAACTVIRYWDPDFTKTTPGEAMAINRAAAEMAAGDYLTDSSINWN